MAEEVTEEQSKSSLKSIVILLAIVILAELTFVFYIITSVKTAESELIVEKKEEQVQNDDSTVISIAYSEPIQILVNVKGTDGDRYFKAEFVIEYDGGAYPLLAEHLLTQKPRFKDIAINIFSNQDMNVLDNAKIREKYSAELLSEIRKYIPAEKGEVKNILINEWLIQ